MFALRHCIAALLHSLHYLIARVASCLLFCCDWAAGRLCAHLQQGDGDGSLCQQPQGPPRHQRREEDQPEQAGGVHSLRRVSFTLHQFHFTPVSLYISFSSHQFHLTSVSLYTGFSLHQFTLHQFWFTPVSLYINFSLHQFHFAEASLYIGFTLC